MRNKIVLFLSLSLFVSSVLDMLLSALGPPTQAAVTSWVYLVLGIIAILYWVRGEREVQLPRRPLGVTLLAAEFFLIGGLVAIEGIILLFLPIFGIISLIIIGLGIGIIYLGKGFWEGAEWGLTVATILAIIGVIVGVVELPFRLGNPILAIFQVWYLRRPHVLDHFYGRPIDLSSGADIRRKHPPPGIPPPSPFASFRTKVCETCGGLNPPTSMYCFNCGLRLFSLPETPAVDEASIRLQLESVQRELEKMDALIKDGKVVDQELFKKAYEQRKSKLADLQVRLSSQTTSS